MNASILSKVEIIIVKLSRIGVIVDFDLSSKLRIILCTLLLSCVCNGLRLDSSFSSRGCCKITPIPPPPTTKNPHRAVFEIFIDQSIYCLLNSIRYSFFSSCACVAPSAMSFFNANIDASLKIK